MDQLAAIRLFARIVELESFTQAASELGLARSAATAAVKQLEARLGVSLLQRTTRRVRPTIDGQSYYEQCLTIIALVEESESSLSHRARHPSGRLKIDLPLSLARLLIVPALPDFHRRYPEINLEVGSGDRVVDLVREGFDCVVRIGAVSDATLVARSLPPLPQVTCASREYIDRHGMPQNLADLVGHQVVDYRSATNDRLMPLEFSTGDFLEVGSAPISVNNGEAYVAAGEAGMGIIQVPAYHVATQIAAGTLVELLPQFRPPPLPLAVLHPASRRPPLRSRCFIDWLVALFEVTTVGSEDGGPVGRRRRPSGA